MLIKNYQKILNTQPSKQSHLSKMRRVHYLLITKTFARYQVTLFISNVASAKLINFRKKWN